MIFNKTDFGRSTLLSNQLQLPADARRVLLLCDGRRSVQAIVKVLGETVVSTLRELERDGLIMQVAALSAKEPEKAIQPVITQHVPERHVAQTQPANGGISRSQPNRSWAASKMYLVSILQMQRDVDSAALAVSLHTSSDPEHIFICILQSLQHVGQIASSSVYRRVFEKVLEVIPETHSPQLISVFSQVFPMELANSA